MRRAIFRVNDDRAEKCDACCHAERAVWIVMTIQLWGENNVGRGHPILFKVQII